MSATLTILYPNEPSTTFDLDYYKNIHMPLVQKHWAKYGLKRWSICKFLSSTDGLPLPYVCYGVIELESADRLEAALADIAMDAMISDVKNYTGIQPVMLLGEVVRDVHL